MGLFDIFTLKKDAKKVFSKENLTSILDTAKAAIIAEVKANVPGPEKKVIVDNIVYAKIDSVTAGADNKIVLWAINGLKGLVPTITQAVYDFLKEKVDNL